MSAYTNEQLAANYMGAIAHLLSGRPGRHREFIKNVELIISGREPNAFQLMQFIDQVRHTGRPVLWIHPPADTPRVPLIGLVAVVGHQAYTVENCVLCTSANGRITRLVPDNFKMGAFEFDEDLRLIHLPKASARSFSAAQGAMIRAYRKLSQIQGEQLSRGEVFAMPQLAQAA